MGHSEQQQSRFIRQAIELARQSIHQGGGPFGAVVVRDGVVIGRGQNRVTLNNDPTAHAEIQAIRDACSHSGDFHLDGCELYVSCQPCPMCLSAAYWSHISTIYYAAKADEAAAAGFLDTHIADELTLAAELRSLPVIHLDDPGAPEVFQLWNNTEHRTDY